MCPYIHGHHSVDRRYTQRHVLDTARSLGQHSQIEAHYGARKVSWQSKLQILAILTIILAFQYALTDYQTFNGNIWHFGNEFLIRSRRAQARTLDRSAWPRLALFQEEQVSAPALALVHALPNAADITS